MVLLWNIHLADDLVRARSRSRIMMERLIATEPACPYFLLRGPLFYLGLPFTTSFKPGTLLRVEICQLIRSLK